MNGRKIHLWVHNPQVYYFTKDLIFQNLNLSMSNYSYFQGLMVLALYHFFFSSHNQMQTILHFYHLDFSKVVAYFMILAHILKIYHLEVFIMVVVFIHKILYLFLEILDKIMNNYFDFSKKKEQQVLLLHKGWVHIKANLLE